ncbi:MAG TPA: YggT family protein [Candidatus Baltobacteraceae bacterium]|nr:YggT family protein [Candidatus Baltobacteraceae bacterium]
MCGFYNSLHYILYIYGLVLLVYALLSWVPDLRGGWARYLDALVEPVLSPVRRVIPPVGGLDMSFIVVMIALYLVNRLIAGAAINACYATF